MVCCRPLPLCVFGPTLLPLPYTSVVVLAAALWTAAFVLFLAVYAPILLTPRTDGKPSDSGVIIDVGKRKLVQWTI
jgi:uncharacterized protein involved in response to NO